MGGSVVSLEECKLWFRCTGLREFPCDTHVILASGVRRGGVGRAQIYVASARAAGAVQSEYPVGRWDLGSRTAPRDVPQTIPGAKVTPGSRRGYLGTSKSMKIDENRWNSMKIIEIR